MLTVEKIGGTSMSEFKDVLNNIIIGKRSGSEFYNRIFVVSAYNNVTNWLLEHKKTGEPGIIDKTRWLVKSGEHTFEVDEFYGENEGLVMAEVELGSEDEAFEKPDFIGNEVTGDKRYYNSHLRECPFSVWGKTEESAVR